MVDWIGREVYSQVILVIEGWSVLSKIDMDESTVSYYILIIP